MKIKRLDLAKKSQKNFLKSHQNHQKMRPNFPKNLSVKPIGRGHIGEFM